MTYAFHAVARGLRVAHVGYLLTCWGATSALGLSWLISTSGYSNDTLRITLFVAFWVNIVIVASGAVTGIVGRVKCLKAPPEFPAVRGRAIAAVVLEGSGWLSGFVGISVAFAMGFKWLPAMEWIPVIGFFFSCLLLLCGRILLLRFLRVLARVVEDKHANFGARVSLLLFIGDWVLALLAWGVGAGGSVLNEQKVTTPLALGIAILAGMSGVAGLVLYDRVLGGLTKSVRAFADAHKDDEELEYLSRRERDEEGEPEAIEDEPAEVTD